MADTVTGAKLIDVAIEMFGRTGLDAVTTRAIADAAGAQQSAISYHFGSKERLYLACAEHIATVMRGKILPLIGEGRPFASAEATSAEVEQIVGGLAVVMMQDDIAPLARFVVREQMNPTAAFAVLYDGAMRHIVEALVSRMSAIAHDRLSAEMLHIRCIALVGQVLVFRFARATLLQVTSWEGVGSRETELVRDTVVLHTRSILADLGKARA